MAVEGERGEGVDGGIGTDAGNLCAHRRGIRVIAGGVDHLGNVMRVIRGARMQTGHRGVLLHVAHRSGGRGLHHHPRAAAAAGTRMRVNMRERVRGRVAMGRREGMDRVL